MVLKNEEETTEEFGERVRSYMADALDISCSKYNRHDWREAVKNLAYNRKPVVRGESKYSHRSYILLTMSLVVHLSIEHV